MNALELRRRTLGKGVYKKTVEGNPAIAQGSLARRYPGITMQGWTEQAQYEGSQLFDISKVTNSNLVENINNDYLIIKSNTGSLPGSPNSLATLCPDLKVGDEIVINAKCENATPYIYLVSSTKRIYFNTPTSLTEDDLKSSVAFYSSSTDVDGKLSEITVNMGETALPYEPYTGGQPSPNPDYPQEIVSAGKYDEGTGKYQYEITLSDNADRAQNLTLISDRPLTKWDRLEKRGGVWGWVYKSDEYTMTGEEAFHVANESYIGELTSDSYINVNNLQERNGCCGFSNYLKIYVGVWGGNFDGVEGFAYNGTQIHVRISNEDTGVVAGDTTGKVRDKIKAYCAQRYADGTPFIFWHETSEETFVPLSESEQEAMNALYTFRPTTVLSNDCECNMKLTYKTKKSLEVTD